VVQGALLFFLERITPLLESIKSLPSESLVYIPSLFLTLLFQNTYAFKTITMGWFGDDSDQAQAYQQVLHQFLLTTLIVQLTGGLGPR
jgi:hypothetical protein